MAEEEKPVVIVDPKVVVTPVVDPKVVVTPVVVEENKTAEPVVALSEVKKLLEAQDAKFTAKLDLLIKREIEGVHANMDGMKKVKFEDID